MLATAWPPASREEVEAQPPAPVTFVFGGDVHFEGRVAASLAGGAGGPLAGMAGTFAPEDIVVVNLETAITESDDAESKQFTFRAPPAVLGELVADGVDVVSLANNHGMDFGLVGLQDTLEAARAAGLPLVGAGTSQAEAFAPWTATIGGHRVAVLGATQVLDSSLSSSWAAGPSSPGLASAKQPAALVEAVTRAAAEADTVAVVLHWGVEKETCPTRAQQDLARAVVEAGADIVVGGHAHRLQGGGHLGQAVVGYGLGNLVFDTRRHQRGRAVGDAAGAGGRPGQVRLPVGPGQARGRAAPAPRGRGCGCSRGRLDRPPGVHGPGRLRRARRRSPWLARTASRSGSPRVLPAQAGERRDEEHEEAEVQDHVAGQLGQERTRRVDREPGEDCGQHRTGEGCVATAERAPDDEVHERSPPDHDAAEDGVDGARLGGEAARFTVHRPVQHVEQRQPRRITARAARCGGDEADHDRHERCGAQPARRDGRPHPGPAE
jgi:hypothetical protein